MTCVSIGQEIGRARAADLLPGDIIPELNWAEVTDVLQSQFGLIGIQTTAGDDVRTEPDRIFQVAHKFTTEMEERC